MMKTDIFIFSIQNLTIAHFGVCISQFSFSIDIYHTFMYHTFTGRFVQLTFNLCKSSYAKISLTLQAFALIFHILLWIWLEMSLIRKFKYFVLAMFTEYDGF